MKAAELCSRDVTRRVNVSSSLFYFCWVIFGEKVT